MYSSKEAGGNPRSTAAHAKVDEASYLMHQAVVDLTATLEKAGGEAGLISGKLCRLVRLIIHSSINVKFCSGQMNSCVFLCNNKLRIGKRGHGHGMQLTI